MPRNLCNLYPCNSIPPYPGAPANPVEGIVPSFACPAAKSAISEARKSAGRMMNGGPANPDPNANCPPANCDRVDIVIKCDTAAQELFNNGTWHTPDGRIVTIPSQYWKACHGLCGRTVHIWPASVPDLPRPPIWPPPTGCKPLPPVNLPEPPYLPGQGLPPWEPPPPETIPPPTIIPE